MKKNLIKLVLCGSVGMLSITGSTSFAQTTPQAIPQTAPQAITQTIPQTEQLPMYSLEEYKEFVHRLLSQKGLTDEEIDKVILSDAFTNIFSSVNWEEAYKAFLENNVDPFPAVTEQESCLYCEDDDDEDNEEEDDEEDDEEEDEEDDEEDEDEDEDEICEDCKK